MADIQIIREMLGKYPHEFVVWVDRVNEPLVEERLSKLRGMETWHAFVKEVWTPKGLPLSFALSIGEKDELAIYSAHALMLSVWPTALSFELHFRLPTDELLKALIQRRRE